MMEIADYWLLVSARSFKPALESRSSGSMVLMFNHSFLSQEKDLIPKLFEVLVPRYENHFGSYTSMRNLPSQELSYRNHRLKLSVLELKGSLHLE